MAFDDILDRTDAAGELPVQLANELITTAIRESVVLTMGHQVPVGTRDSRIPVLSELPDAEWITAGPPSDDVDSGMKQTTKAAFTNEPLTAEELATICVIPNSVVEDSQFDLWSAVKPLLARAIARKFDDAVMFGNGAPATFPPGLTEAAVAAGNVVSGPVMDPATDNAVLVLEAAQLVGEMGYNANALAVAPAWEFRAGAQRSTAFAFSPIGADTPFPAQIAGLGVRTRPLRWDKSKADAIVADWSLVVIGLRQQIRLESFNTGVLSDTTGLVTVNLLQQDAQAIRVTFRGGYLLAAPPTDYVGPPAPCPVAIVTDDGTFLRTTRKAPATGAHASTSKK